MSITMRAAVCAENDMDNCYLSDIDYAENHNLTREERIKAMDEALFRSINKFEECVLPIDNSTGSNGGGGSDQGVGGISSDPRAVMGTEENDVEAGTAVDSIADGELSGTEAEPIDIGNVTGIVNNNKSSINDAKAGGNYAITHSGQAAGSGKAPEDIPAADNDDLVAAQIRLAAEIETDPEKKAKLWSEYRKYKGMPATK